jgi:hypothetical protein
MAKTVTEIRAMLPPAGKFDLPNGGQISASEINVELGRSFDAKFDINGTEERALAGKPSGQIAFSDFHGKSTWTHQMLIGSQPAAVFEGLRYGYNFAGSALMGSLTPFTVEGTVPAGAETVQLIADILLYDEGGPVAKATVYFTFAGVTSHSTVTLEVEGLAGVYVFPKVGTFASYVLSEGMQPLFDFFEAAVGTTVNLKLTAQ